jgi:2-methylcitrate dehydratase PrpD
MTFITGNKMRELILESQKDPMSILCKIVVATKYEDLPDNVIRYAKYSILDTVAVTIGGSAMAGIPEVVNLIKEKGGKPESILPFYGGKVPASEAGFAIGPMSRAMDFGQVHAEGGHCSEFIVPALLASTGLAAKVTGKEFITAFTLGQEILLRIGIAYKAVSRGSSSGRGTGHSIFGAVASVGKLIGLSLEDLENAEGIARCMTQPHDTAFVSPPTLILRVHHGFICQDAINACLLAKRGITGPRREVLTGFRGYLGLAQWETDPNVLTEDLGEEWHMLNARIKPYSSCMHTHSAIYVILDQMKKHDFKADEISHIDVELPAQSIPIIVSPEEIKWNPRSEPECQFSLPYVLATAACTGDVFLESYTPEAMAREDVRMLMTRISATEASDLPAFTARITTTLINGAQYSNESLHVKGHPENPFTKQELIDKFKKCATYSAYKLSRPTTESLIDVLMNLEDVDNIIDDLIHPLTPN